jgi:hypothetical protein
MSFADVMPTHTGADLIIVDRRHAPGGHWNDAYPFARLHMPPSCCGVDSMSMGNDEADPEQDERLYENAFAAEICAYYDWALHQRFLASGRVRFRPSVEHLGIGVPRSRVDGAETTLRHTKLVDATYIEGSIPATTPAPF